MFTFAVTLSCIFHNPAAEDRPLRSPLRTGILISVLSKGSRMENTKWRSKMARSLKLKRRKRRSLRSKCPTRGYTRP
ncbi:hypothetical protein BJX96DRAFT_151135 [Aspergillus floccosus]